MPAAVPLTAAMTGTSQSRTAATRRWAPSRRTRDDVADGPLGRALGPHRPRCAGRAGRRRCRRPCPWPSAPRPGWPGPPTRRASRSMTRSRWSGVRALPTSGRLRVIHATPPSMAVLHLVLERSVLGHGRSVGSDLTPRQIHPAEGLRVGCRHGRGASDGRRRGPGQAHPGPAGGGRPPRRLPPDRGRDGLPRPGRHPHLRPRRRPHRRGGRLRPPRPGHRRQPRPPGPRPRRADAPRSTWSSGSRPGAGSEVGPPMPPRCCAGPRSTTWRWPPRSGPMCPSACAGDGPGSRAWGRWSIPSRTGTRPSPWWCPPFGCATPAVYRAWDDMGGPDRAGRQRPRARRPRRRAPPGPVARPPGRGHRGGPGAGRQRQHLVRPRRPPRRRPPRRPQPRSVLTAEHDLAGALRLQVRASRAQKEPSRRRV